MVLPDTNLNDPVTVKSIAILNPKGDTKSPVVITNEKGISDSPCSFEGSVFASDLLVKAMKDGSMLVVSADSKKDVWLAPSFFYSVKAYKKGQQSLHATIALPDEDAFVLHVDPKDLVVYIKYTHLADTYSAYSDYPGVKSEKPYLVLKVSPTSFEFINVPEIYMHAKDYRGRTPYTEEKGHYRQNDNYEFRFSLDVCT